MAIAYLDSESNNPENAFDNINQVSTSGFISNRALLGSGWTSVNNGDYRTALTPLKVLQSRSMAIPEVQEAVLLIPHVYEKLGLNGRAADGFIKAYARYSSALDQLTEARNTLRDADMLELFVRNLDEILNDSDWFGTAPSVSLNSLSPFLIDLMSDHSFQSVLKELRDLYAIRNNLESWKKRRNDFDIMLNARLLSTDINEQSSQIESASQQQAELQKELAALSDHAEFLDAEERERVQWLLGDIRFEIEGASRVVAQLESPPSFKATTREYAGVLDSCMKRLDGELERTNVLVEKVEQVMLELVNAELNIHEERLKYYRVQSHLAKVRILDSSLADLEPDHYRQTGDEPDLEQEQIQERESHSIKTEPSRVSSDAT